MINWLNDLFQNNPVLSVGLSGFIVVFLTIGGSKIVRNKYINNGTHRGDVVFGDKKRK